MFSKKDRTLLNPFCQPGYFNPSLGKKSKSSIVWIALVVHHTGDLGVDQHLGAQDAGLVCAVEGGSFYAHTVKGSLDYGVLLGVNGPTELVASAAGHSFAGTSGLVAVLEACGRAVVSCCQQPLVLDEECSHLVSKAGGPLGDH